MKKGDDMTQSTRKLTMGSLFDGIGGFPLASVRCGIEPIWASEIEPFPILVSKIRFPRMEQMGDIICCSSTMTDKSGNLQSRIRPTLREGSIVTDTRCNVQYLVTEYGIVNLKGASTWERAEKIISIAHPDFREALIKEAEKLKIWKATSQRC